MWTALVPRAWRWVPAQPAAWAIGMIVAFAGPRIMDEDASALAVVGTAAAVGIGAGANGGGRSPS